MKIFYIILFSTFLFSSCVKKYSCKCTSKISLQYYLPYETTTIVEIDEKKTKKKATQMCDHAAKQLTANTKLLYPNFLDIGSECILKDY